MTIDRVFKTVTLDKWKDIEKYAKPTDPGWLFRGQGSADRELETSLERCCRRHGVEPAKRDGLEGRLLRDFRRSYHHYARHIPNQKSVVEWLSLMQHHGAPTRLLDFTYSIYVATYFATEAADGDSAVWAIDGPWAMAQAATLLRAGGKPDTAVDLMMEYFDEHADEVVSDLFFKEPYVCAAWPINAFRLNERLRIQQGVFMIPGDVTRTFMANLKALTAPDAQDHLLKIIIPHDMGRKAIRHLYSMGISRTNLFPGLDGYAQSLKVWHPAFDPVDWKRSKR